ncbi:MAG: hypothetical protein KC613_05120, partial [Myxococcales bacterium]|nr:hypothetical protein [Myxococcales bacterium]
PSAVTSADPRAVRRAIAVQAPDERAGQAPAVRRRARMAPEDVHHAATGVSPLVYQCYQARVAAGARPAGQLKLAFTLVKRGGYGEPTALSVQEEAVGDPALVECIRGGRVEAFPVMGDDAEIDLSIPFTLPPPEEVEGSAP